MTFELIPNPAYEGKTPRKLVTTCHDRSPFITIRCQCGYELHMHETQITHAPSDAEIVSRCHKCNKLLIFPPGLFKKAFRELRDDGWIN